MPTVMIYTMFKDDKIIRFGDVVSPSTKFKCPAYIRSLWPPYGRPLYFCPVVSSSIFYLLLLFSSPNLSRRRLDVCHTSTHGVALVRIYDAGLKRAARGSLKIQDAKKSPKIAIWAPSHDFVRLYLRN